MIMIAWKSNVEDPERFPTHVASVFTGSEKDRSKIGTDRIMVCKLWVKFQALCVVEARYAGLLSWPQENWLYVRNTVFHSLFSCRKLSAWLFRSGCSSFRLALIKVENRRQDTIRIRVGYEGIMSSRLFVDTLLRHLIWQKPLSPELEFTEIIHSRVLRQSFNMCSFQCFHLLGPSMNLLHLDRTVLNSGHLVHAFLPLI